MILGIIRIFKNFARKKLLAAVISFDLPNAIYFLTILDSAPSY